MTQNIGTDIPTKKISWNLKNTYLEYCRAKLNNYECNSGLEMSKTCILQNRNNQFLREYVFKMIQRMKNTSGTTEIFQKQQFWSLKIAIRRVSKLKYEQPANLPRTARTRSYSAWTCILENKVWIDTELCIAPRRGNVSGHSTCYSGSTLFNTRSEFHILRWIQLVVYSGQIGLDNFIHFWNYCYLIFFQIYTTKTISGIGVFMKITENYTY